MNASTPNARVQFHSYQYDTQGNVTRFEHRDASNNLLDEGDYLFDGLGNLIFEDVQGKTPRSIYYENAAYPHKATKVEVHAPEGTRTWFYSYNEHGNLCVALRDDKVLRTYEYDARNRLTHAWRGNFAELDRQVTYDALGRVVGVYSKEYEAVIHFGYNMHGHVTAISDDHGIAAQFDYAASGAVSRTTILSKSWSPTNPASISTRNSCSYGGNIWGTRPETQW